MKNERTLMLNEVRFVLIKYGKTCTIETKEKLSDIEKEK